MDLKVSILEFFSVGKFGKYFLGWIDLSRDFWGIQNILKICGGSVVLQKKNSPELGLRNLEWDFMGVNI